METELLTTIFLVLLAVAWVAVLLPPLVRAMHGAPLSTSERFKRRMDLISPESTGAGRWVVVLNSPHRKARASFREAVRMRRAARRRRRLLFLFAFAIGATGAVAVARGGGWLEIHLAADAAFALYCVYLLESSRRRRERSRIVRPLAGRRTARRDVDERMYEPLSAAGGGQS
jgi:hypothetical protein